MSSTSMDTEAIGTIVSSLGVVGALVWFLYYNTAITLPGITKQYTESQERVSNKFADSQKQITDNFSATLREEREYRKQEIHALQNWIKTEASCKYNQDQRNHREST